MRPLAQPAARTPVATSAIKLAVRKPNTSNGSDVCTSAPQGRSTRASPLASAPLAYSVGRREALNRVRPEAAFHLPSREGSFPRSLEATRPTVQRFRPREQDAGSVLRDPADSKQSLGQDSAREAHGRPRAECDRKRLLHGLCAHPTGLPVSGTVASRYARANASRAVVRVCDDRRALVARGRDGHGERRHDAAGRRR